MPESPAVCPVHKCPALDPLQSVGVMRHGCRVMPCLAVSAARRVDGHGPWAGTPTALSTAKTHARAHHIPPKELWAMSRVHWRQAAQKRRKKMGSSEAYKTRGTFQTCHQRPPAQT